MVSCLFFIYQRCCSCWEQWAGGKFQREGCCKKARKSILPVFKISKRVLLKRITPALRTVQHIYILKEGSDYLNVCVLWVIARATVKPHSQFLPCAHINSSLLESSKPAPPFSRYAAEDEAGNFFSQARGLYLDLLTNTTRRFSIPKLKY